MLNLDLLKLFFKRIIGDNRIDYDYFVKVSDLMRYDLPRPKKRNHEITVLAGDKEFLPIIQVSTGEGQ